MTNRANWRRWATCAMIDAVLLLTAGHVMAAPAAGALPGGMPVVPTLAVLAVVLLGATLHREAQI